MKTTPLMQSNIAAQARRVSALTRRGTRGKRRLGDIIFRNFTLLFVLITLALVVGVAWILVSYSLPTITAFVMELLVAIPSVVIGLWGFLVLASWLNSSGEPWLQSHLGFLPFFRGQPHGLGLLAAGIVLVIMILPLIISVSREVMLTVPQSQREALLALGATRWEVIRHVVLPASRVGIMGGIILALGRALGETMAVTMVIGNQATTPSASLFDTGYTLSSVIANQFGEATQGLFLSALLEAGLLVFLITLATNVLARWLVARMGRMSIGGLNT